MKLSLWASVLWATGFGLNLALVLVLFRKRRYRIVPWFTAWIVVEAIYTLALFLIYRFGSHALYAVGYWISDFLDVALQIAVIWEIARHLFRRFGSWVEGSRLTFGWIALGAVTVSGILAWWMTPFVQTRLQSIAARSSLFTTVLVCLLLTAVTFRARQLGVDLRDHVLRESYGFIVWNLVAFVTDSLHSYWRAVEHFTFLENIRIVVFQASLVYWCIAFWLPGSEAVPPRDSEEKSLKALAARLGYVQSGPWDVQEK